MASLRRDISTPREVAVQGGCSWSWTPLSSSAAPLATKGESSGPLQVGRVVVVQGEPLLEVLGQLPFRMKGGQARGAGLLPGAGVPVVGGVEQVHGLAGEEKAVLPALGHAPHYRGHPAAAAQAAQHGPHPVLGHSCDRGQIGHGGQGHPGGDLQQSSLFVVELLSPGHHRHPSSTWTPPLALLWSTPSSPTWNSLQMLDGCSGGSSRQERRRWGEVIRRSDT